MKPLHKLLAEILRRVILYEDSDHLVNVDFYINKEILRRLLNQLIRELNLDDKAEPIGRQEYHANHPLFAKATTWLRSIEGFEGEVPQ